ncbi:MAG: trypsin-like serine protease [Clostridiales bacterium]|nr:trypsin-like serine protease [Clostridiales bacterium]
MKKKLLSLITILVLAFSLSACTVVPSGGSGFTQGYNVTVNVTTGNEHTYTSLVEMLDAVRPSVVEIYTQSNISQGMGAGSGIVISRTGLETANDFSDDEFIILTCHHVINATDYYLVKDIDGNDYSASLIGGDPESDIAVLRVYPYAQNFTEDKVKLSVAKVRDIGDKAKLKVGEEVVAIGNPLGTLGGSVTKGIVSSVDRSVNVAGQQMELIQTDCATNNGNSGGGLFDVQGNLLGVTNAGYNGFQGLNFAIPIDDVISVYTSLVNTFVYDAVTNKYNYGYVEGRVRACVENNHSLSFGSQIAIYDYSSNFRAFPACVMGVKEGSVYDKAGFKVGDMITSVTYKGQTHNVVYNVLHQEPAYELVEHINALELSVGDSIEFTVSRSNSTVKLTVTYEQFIYGDTGYRK